MHYPKLGFQYGSAYLDAQRNRDGGENYELNVLKDPAANRIVISLSQHSNRDTAAIIACSSRTVQFMTIDGRL